jgi:hypothetical protein
MTINEAVAAMGVGDYHVIWAVVAIIFLIIILGD